ncbi:DUF871 domain-containing protein [Latilactobacillus curvatus]|uniref:DUF871 domain-containing protein n=1 Tax=Latilactobacillus curvatus TaxID=28038 RepID=UPI0028B9D22E|nr:DUF871 domain-containing protein [Latilactobacillus curvatus]MDT7017198.1 DUF871 domain-containing protein [Latilactobacillus curvatus]
MIFFVRTAFGLILQSTNLHFNRGDINSYSIRSTFVKLKYKSADMPVNNALPALERGMITIGNNDFGQYKAEVNIVKQAMPNKEATKMLLRKLYQVMSIS